VHTVQDIPAGLPLCISYCCPTNPSELFARYGFIDKTSPATFCKIMGTQSFWNSLLYWQEKQMIRIGMNILVYL